MAEEEHDPSRGLPSRQVTAGWLLVSAVVGLPLAGLVWLLIAREGWRTDRFAALLIVLAFAVFTVVGEGVLRLAFSGLKCLYRWMVSSSRGEKGASPDATTPMQPGDDSRRKPN